jgi:hypothetical protein
MSCTCQVIWRPYIYIPSTYIPKIIEGGDSHLKDKVWTHLKVEPWDKEVIIIASAHGFTPHVQECFYRLVALALAWLTFIYNAAKRA